MNEQDMLWKNEFGVNYQERNPLEVDDMNNLYVKNFGITREAMNKEVLMEVNKNSKILEVGCNVGTQISILQEMGYIDISGIEIALSPLVECKKKHIDLNIIQGNAKDLPYKDNYFDMVFTSGVLIHIHESNLDKVMDEMYRVSKRYIWCYEYYSDEREMIKYRGIDNVLWKDNFAKRFLERYPALRLVKSKKVKYLDNDNVDEMFLLEKVMKSDSQLENREFGE